ncbi:MAG: LCP family protein [Elainellaceae cyanobacterium]
MKRLEQVSDPKQKHAPQPNQYQLGYLDDSSPSSAHSHPPSKLTRGLLWGFSFLIAAIASGTLGVVVALMAPITPDPSQPSQEPFKLGDLWRKGIRHQVAQPVNILVMGIDEVADVSPTSDEIFAGRSDTMLLVHIDPADQTANILSIPRDTQVEFPGRSGVTKINHANYVGGPRLASEVLSYNLNGVEVDRYVRFSTGAFRELVDLLGGVEVFVPHRMRYIDRTQDLEIDLDQGWQTLDGDQAEQFARFRNDAFGDIGRVQRQQILMKALMNRLTSPSVLPRIPQILQLFRDSIDTNLTLEEMLAIANFGMDLDSEQLRMVMLPGQFSDANEYLASYWMMDSSEVSQVMRDYFHVSPIGELVTERSISNLKIAVQNASHDPQLVREVVRYLHDQGFEHVYEIQDWPESYQETQIIAQRGNLHGADRLEMILGVGRVISASTGDLGSDLTIRVGDDWIDQHGI